MAFALVEKTDIAQKHLISLTPPPPSQSQQNYIFLFEHLIETYLVKMNRRRQLICYGYIWKKQNRNLSTQDEYLHLHSHHFQVGIVPYQQIPSTIAIFQS